MAVVHLYVGDEQTSLVRAICGWRVAIRHTTWDWKWVTCSMCLGKRDGMTKLALQKLTEEL